MKYYKTSDYDVIKLIKKIKSKRSSVEPWFAEIFDKGINWNDYINETINRSI